MLTIVQTMMALLSLLHHQPAHKPPPAPQRASRGAVRSTAPRSSSAAASPSPARASGSQLGVCGGWRSLVASYQWDVDRVCRILMCESRGDPNARNGRYHGLMQIAGGSFDPVVNLSQAHDMFVRRGFQPWECR